MYILKTGMYCRSVFVLLSLFVAAVTSQDTPACTDAENALEANQNCSRALIALEEAVSLNRSISAGVDLDAYCAADCRNLVNRQITACDDEEDDGAAAFLSLTPVVCATDPDGMSCADYLYLQRSRFEEVYNNFTSETSGVCPFGMPEQGCSSACQTAIQNSVTNGGCCVQYLLQFGSDQSSKELLARCDIDYSRGGTCVEIGSEIGGGTTGLKAFGSSLLFAVIIAVTLI